MATNRNARSWGEAGSRFAFGPAWRLAILPIALLPLLVSPIIPSVDFYNHVARYYVLSHIDEFAVLARNYQPEWKLLPNLGLDLISYPIFSAFPPLVGAKMVLTLILLVQFGGVLALNKALNGRTNAITWLMAGMLLYSHILFMGFANFLLAQGLSLWALAAWVKLRERSLWLAAGVNAILALLIFFCHGFAFALYGLTAGFLELGRALHRRALTLRELLPAGAALAVQAVMPAVIFLMTPTAEAGRSLSTVVAGHLAAGSMANRLVELGLQQLNAILRVMRGPWFLFDVATFAALAALLVWCLRRGIIRLNAVAVPLLLLAGVLCVLTPPSLFGVGRISDRAPLLAALLLAAAVTPGRHWQTRGRDLAICAFAALFLLRIGASAFDFSRYARDFQDFAAVARQTPRDALIGSGIPPKLRRLRGLDIDGVRDGLRCDMYPVLAVSLFHHPTLIFSVPSQQPLSLKGELARRSAMETDFGGTENDRFTHRIVAYPYYLSCGYRRIDETRFRVLAAQGRFMLVQAR